VSTISGHVWRTCQALGRIGFSLADHATVAEGRDVAAQLVGERIATTEIMWAVQTRSGCAAFAAREPDGGLCALISVLPLLEDGERALDDGSFDGLVPPLAVIARPQDEPVAFYIWGAAGLTWRGRNQALAASVALQREVYPHLPCFARGATSDGERVLQSRMGAMPAAGGLVRAQAWWDQRRRAA
jgi:hypothetical protein